MYICHMAEEGFLNQDETLDILDEIILEDQEEEDEELEIDYFDFFDDYDYYDEEEEEDEEFLI